jgi:hypothetical protein
MMQPCLLFRMHSNPCGPPNLLLAQSPLQNDQAQVPIPENNSALQGRKIYVFNHVSPLFYILG